MDLPANLFRRRLASGPPALGLWLGLTDPGVAEIVAGAGFDWLLIDHEHGPFELADVLAHLRAVAPYPVAPVVRPVDDDPALLKKLLDIGVQSFLVPMVESATRAEAIVQSLRYPPAGARGLGTSLARAAHWNQIPDYLQRANQEICLIVQVETVAAMSNLQAILDVDGVDGVFIGPSDLSASMGHVGEPSHPAVIAAINGALETIVAAGKFAGLMCLDPLLSADYVARGACFIGVGTDTLLLSQGARRLIGHYAGDGDGDGKGDSRGASY
jgi:4-hydroxy-2-oxoheptanedioate aldolase